MKRTKLNNDKFTALYCRLSKDDGTNNESINYARPAFRQLIEDIKVEQKNQINLSQTCNIFMV